MSGLREWPASRNLLGLQEAILGLQEAVLGLQEGVARGCRKGLQEGGCRSKVTGRGCRKGVAGAGLREGVAGRGLQEQGCRKGLQEQGCRGHPRAPAPLKFWCRKQRSLDVNHSVSMVVRRKILFFSDDINETAIKR